MVSPELLGLIAPALAAGLTVAVTHVPLGQEVLRRGIIFIDLAIAQIAALGVVVAELSFPDAGRGLASAAALAFALAGSCFFRLAERFAPRYQEALIGSAFVVTAALILLLLADDPHGGEEVKSILAGQILWVEWESLGVFALVSMIILYGWFALRMVRGPFFYVLFPLAVTFSVQLVGVYLVFASLILPALAAAPWGEGTRLLMGYAAAAIAVSGGIVASLALDMPTGPALVCAYALASVGIAALARFARPGGS